MLSTGERRVLIVSSHPLFSEGLHSLLKKHAHQNIQVIGLATGMDEALQLIEDQTPDLVVVDYDDQSVSRADFLAHMICKAFQLRVVLFSLMEGGSEAIVYDRRTTDASRIDDWLHEPDMKECNCPSSK